MLHFAHLVINYVIDHWPAISALVGGGAGLSVFLEYVLHKLHVDSKQLAYSLLHLLSILAAVSAYYLDNTNVLPTYAGLVIAAQTIHRFVVSPYYNAKVLPYLTYLSQSQAQPTTQYQPPLAAPAQPAVETAAPSFEK